MRILFKWMAAGVAGLGRLRERLDAPANNPRDFLRALFARYVLRKPWSAISARNGLALLTDHIHLNERGAAVIAELIGAFLASHPAGRQHHNTTRWNYP